MNKPVSKLAALGLTAVYASRGRAHTHIHVHSRAYKTAHMAGACTHTNTQVHIHIPAYKIAHTAGTPVSDVHTQVHVHIPAYKTAHTAGMPVWDVHTHIYMYTALPTRLHIWQGRAHTQTHKYMYTSLPSRPHIRQVRRSGTCTHTNIQVHVHICAYKTAHRAGTLVRDAHIHKHTST